MAEVVINKKVEFAYATQNMLSELAKELEKRYLYQKILIVNNKYELSDQINALIKNVKCDFLVVRELADCKTLEDFACVIVVNCHDIINIKITCTAKNKPYIFALTKIFDTTFLNNQIVDEHKNIVDCNYPLGVVLVKSKVLNKQDFICKFLLEFVNFIFDNTQAKIDNLFFLNHKGEFLNDKDIFKKISNNVILTKDSEELFNNISKFYLLICIKKSLKPLSLLDRVSELGNDFAFDNQHKIEARFLLQYALTLVTKDFFELWTNKLKSTIDIKKHQAYIQKYGLSCDFKINEPPEQKINFLLSEFKSKLITYTDEQLSINSKIKSLIADINVDFLYKVFSTKFKNSLTDFVCLEPDIYNKNSILKILSANGLLNFDF